MARSWRARDDVSRIAPTACYALAHALPLVTYEPQVCVDLIRTLHKREHLIEMRYELRVSDAIASGLKLLNQERQLPLIEASIARRIKKPET